MDFQTSHLRTNLRPVVLAIIALLGVVLVSVGVNFLSIPWIGVHWATSAISKVLQGVGTAVLIAALIPMIEGWVLEKARGTPVSDILDNDSRCGALTNALGNSGKEIVMTTRYSRRNVGQTPKSKAFVHALESRINLARAETYRIVSLDNDKKLQHARRLLTEYATNRKFALAVQRPSEIAGWPDLFVVANQVACVGVETPDPDENYWVRIRDRALVERLRQMYRDRHWASAEILKEANCELDTEALDAALEHLREVGKECGCY